MRGVDIHIEAHEEGVHSRPRYARRVYNMSNCSANGNRTRESGSRPLPSNTGESFLVRVFAFSSPD